MKATCRTRTGDLSFTKARVDSVSTDSINTSDAPNEAGRNPGRNGEPIDPDLRRLIEAWPTLPEALRKGITAMIEAATPRDH